MAQVVAVVIISNLLFGAAAGGVGFGIGHDVGSTSDSDNQRFRDVSSLTNDLEDIISNNNEMKDGLDKMIAKVHELALKYDLSFNDLMQNLQENKIKDIKLKYELLSLIFEFHFQGFYIFFRKCESYSLKNEELSKNYETCKEKYENTFSKLEYFQNELLKHSERLIKKNSKINGFKDYIRELENNNEEYRDKCKKLKQKIKN
jgi:hypothetical protein